MEQAHRRTGGKIAGFLSSPREKLEALEADLINRGYTLDDIPARLSWRSVLAWLEHAPRDSNLARANHGARTSWGETEHLLAAAVDTLRVANWQRTTDGSKGINPPAPLPRPGFTDDGDPVNERRFGSGAIPAADFYAWFYADDPETTEEEDAARV